MQNKLKEHAEKEVKNQYIKNVLRDRARSLAEEIIQDEGSQDKIEVVEFIVENEKYGIESEYIQNVQSLDSICYLPKLPPYFMGIINVHGVIISVIDIAKFFEIKAESSLDKKIIILNHENVTLGICVNTILDVVAIKTDTIQTDLSNMSGIRKEYLKGITLDQLALIDPEKLCTDKKVMINQDAT